MKDTILILCVCLLLLQSGCIALSNETPEFDLIIKNGRVMDGTGNPWFIADIGVKNGKIVRIGDLTKARGIRAIDAKGLIVCPGFIDLHNHSDMGFLTQPTAENYVRQGVTTLFVGHCGNSVVPSDDFPSFREYFARLEKQGISANVVALIGHGQIRKQVIGGEDREPTPQELEKMKAIVAQALEDGACGLSTGLVYFPGTYAKTAEIIELCKVVAGYDGLYATHVRDDTAKWEESVLEAIETAERSRVRLQIVHNETHYPNWGKLDLIMRHIEEAREREVRVSCDVVPTLCGSQGIKTVFPNWSLEGGDTKLIERLKNPEERAKIKSYVLEEKEKHTSPSSTLIADGHADKIWIAGKNLAEIARERGQEPVDAAIDLVIEKDQTFGIIMEFHDEDDLCKLISHPLSSIISDGAIQVFEEEIPHPRTYGCFPLIFRKYVRGETREEESREVGRKILSLQEAVRKVTSCPAQVLQLKDRGLLREGMWADIVIFDPYTITDKATYANPHQYPEGIPYVIVNGQIVIENSKHIGTRPGQVIRGPISLRQLSDEDNKQKIGDTRDKNFLTFRYHSVSGIDQQYLDLDVYPSEGVGLPVVLFFHGGDLSLSRKKWDKASVRKTSLVNWFKQKGAVLVSANYRGLDLAGSIDEVLRDGARAVKWIEEHIHTYGGDSHNLYIIGHSAGAYFAAMLGADSTYIEEVGGNYGNLQGVMPVDGGQYDIPQLIQQAESQGFSEFVKRLKRIFGTERSEQFKASPIPRLTLESSYPKFLILYAFDMYGQRQTFTKDQAHLLKDAVIRVNGSADVFEGADKDHLTILKDIGVEGEPVTGVVASFLSINKE